MRRRVVMLLTLATLLLVSAACGLLEEPPTPSTPLEAVPLEETETEATPTKVPAPTEEETGETAETEEMAGDEVAAESDATGEVTAGEEATAGSGERRIYTIVAGDSRVRFELDEDLRGQRTMVVGTSDQVTGEIGFNLSDLSTAEVGVIQINARTISTDNNFRNRAIQNEILDTGAFEFITFTPTGVNGLPASIAAGEEVAFTIDGELTIRDVTQPVTFNVVATPVSAEELVGTAGTTVSREAFGLRIPEVPSVANVEDEVDLYIDFVARSREG